MSRDRRPRIESAASARSAASAAKIDYQPNAANYRRTRTLPPPVLNAWAGAVAALGLGRAHHVADIGCGTGQFLEPLGHWFDATVIGIEPSSAMLDQARSHSDRDGPAAYVAGVAEHLPLRDHSIDISWLSTVVHQFTNLDHATKEIHRISRPSGHVLIRGYFSDLPVGEVTAMFPGIERAAATFPSTTKIVAAFEAAGFVRSSITHVREAWPFNLNSWVHYARTMRHTDSILRPLTDHEIETGIATVTDQHQQSPRNTNEGTLALIALRRQ